MGNNEKEKNGFWLESEGKILQRGKWKLADG
jgi:hypothetical protein